MGSRNFCIVVIGKTEGIKFEITKISETEPNFLDGQGLFIATFTSFLKPSEITEFLKQSGWNFMIFELDKNKSGFNITNKTIHEGLFGFVDKIDNEKITNSFLETVKEMVGEPLKDDTVDCEVVFDFKVDMGVKNILNSEEIEKMGTTQRQDLLNELIELGLEKLTEEDKKLLPLLAK